MLPPLTVAQNATLKAFIEADPVLNALPRHQEGYYVMAQALNLPHATTIVWRTNVAAQEIMSNGFVWTAVDALQVGKARIWDWMTRYGSINPSKANIRQGLADCFGAGSAMQTAIAPHLKRLASRVEALSITGTGTDASPGTMLSEGPVTMQEIDTLFAT